MMGLVDWARLVGCSLLSLFIFLIQRTWAQEGFLSLQCCAPSNISDPSTNISWTSDVDWIHNVGECQNVYIPVVDDTSYKWARVFRTHSGKKWCYNLTTIKDRDYLIRGTFLHGLSLNPSVYTLFNVSLSATSISQVNSSDDSSVVEGIFRASTHYIDFCLVWEKGFPYLSMLELRPLSDLLYPELDSSNVLKVVSRVDFGNTERPIRYPYDTEDQIWGIDESLSKNAVPISNASISIYGANVSVPIQVLQTALTNMTRLEFLHNGLDTSNNNYLVYLYFLELNDSVKSGQRVFDIYANGEKRYEKFDVLGNGTMSNYRKAVLNIATDNGVLNVSLIGDSHGLGPICNAYEILQVRTRVEGTFQEDVDVILEVRDELVVGNPENEILRSWSGDPCLPVPWQGLGCELRNGSFVITMLNLSSNGLQGSLPPHITELTYLKELNLSFNRLSGTIPSFPVSSKLISMDLSHNELMGLDPESLSSLPHLTRLNFGCNPHFSNELPSNLLKRSNLTTDSGKCGGQRYSHSQQQIFIGSVAGGCLLFIIVVGVVFVWFYRQRLMDRGRLDGSKHPITKSAVFSLPSMDDLYLTSIFIQTFTLECIETATHKYKTLIGEGGFGSVYRGTLPNGQEVAVKVRSATSTQGTREFENELNLLSAIQHENLVPLLGYCCENDQQILVYPFMSNGSLQDRLYGEAAKRKTLDWPTRLSIALGAARGLLYLHTFAGRCVIHRDVKSSNILLDQSMCAKVADFGFSKYAPQEGDSGASLEVRGTAGYLDPEYYSTQHLSAKSDVFSFGVVLLEIVSGREPLNIHRPRNEWSLVEWAKPFIKDSRIEEIVDPGIKAAYHAEAMWRVVEVALACIEPYSAYRPCMADIVRELEDALIIENNASEYMKSIDSFGGSNRFSIEKKIIIPPTPTPTEPSPIISQALAPPQPR